MKRPETCTRLLVDLNSEDDQARVAAALELLALGEYGEPAGTYLLKGGKLAIRQHRLADAVVLLYHGVRVAEPHTLVWAELLVQRAVACAHHGFWSDAISAAETYLNSLSSLPIEAAAWEPFAHHALGMAYDRLQRYSEAVPHHQHALHAYSDAVRQCHVACDLAYSLALSGKAEDAEQVLLQLGPKSLTGIGRVGFWCTAAVVRYCLGQFSESLVAAEEAESAAAESEEALAVPLAEMYYWRSRAAWQVGDRYHAGLWALRSAVMADQQWRLDLRDTANAWLAEMKTQGGITGA